MAASAALEQRSSRRAQLARVNTHIYTLDQFTLSLKLIYACVQVYLHRSKAIYTCGDLEEAIARIVPQVGQASPISGVPSDTCMGGSGGEEEGEDHLHLHHAHLHLHGDPHRRKAADCSWGPGHFCVH